jgi:hypothetical protein
MIPQRNIVVPRMIAESGARFGGDVVAPIWSSCGMAMSATAGALAGRSGASGRGCRHRVPGGQLGGASAASGAAGRTGSAGCPRCRSRSRPGVQRYGLRAREAAVLRGDGLRQV